MRSAAIDLGKVRVGLAVSDELGLMAHARPFLDGRNPGRLVDALHQLATSEGIEVFVVGLPLAQDGNEGPAALRARTFAGKLQLVTRRRVILMDERYTTKQASQQLRMAGHDSKRQRTVIDSASAVVLLQAYLDALPKARST
jgi:putative Holliday junction resolvase